MKSLKWMMGAAVLFVARFAAAEEVRYVPARQYADALVSEIGKASSTVDAFVYLFTLYSDLPDNPTTLVAEALGAAVRRGVRVTVALDQGGGFGGEPAGPAENLAARDFLKARGVDAYLEDDPATLHAKAVVIDGTTVILGSGNWTENSFNQNLEAGMLVRSTQAAADLLADFKNLPRQPVPPEEKTGALVPLTFLTEPGLLGDLATRGAERSFDLYLFLLRESLLQGKTSFALSYDRTAEALGIVDAGSVTYRGLITKVLQSLQDKNGLIHVTPHYGADATVEMVPLAGEAVPVPEGYFSWGWNRSLSFKGKMAYVIDLYYSETSFSRPRWSMAQEELTRRTHVKPWLLSNGFAELRRENLLEVDTDDLPVGGKETRRPNAYTPKALYDPQALAARWAALEKTYGADRLARGKACANLVFADSDADAVERFIVLEEKYGREKMDRVFQLIGDKSSENPRRTVGYFIRTVESLK